MAKLTPVDFDPFAGGAKLTPVDYNPFNGEPAKPEDTTSLGRTALEQGLQGATFGFADEITDRLGALGASVVTGEKYDDVLKDARASSKQRMQAQLQERPVTSILANIGGGLLTGGALTAPKAIAGTAATTGARGLINAIPKGGEILANSIRSGGTAARIAKGALAGAASGALYGAGAADEGQRLEGAGQGAVLGGAVGGAVPAIGAAVSGTVNGAKNAAQGLVARGADELSDDLANIRAQSNAAYQKMRATGAVLTPKASQQVMQDVESALRSSGPLNARIHGNTVAVVKDLKGLAKKGKLGLEELDQYRQLFGDMAGDIGNKSNARTAGIVRSAIDDALDGLDDGAFKTGSKDALTALKQGRAEYARARKFEMVADVVRKSEGDANYVKRELTKILNNPKKSRGFNGDELAALKEASRLSGGEAILKIAGKFGFDPARLGSGVGAVFGGTGGAILGGASGAATVPAVGTAARYGQKLLTRGKTERLLQTIEGAISPQAGQLPRISGGMTGAIAGGEAALQGHTPPIPSNTYTTVTQPMSATMTLPQDDMSALPQDILRDEGLRFNAYNDHLGNRTVGVGFNMDSPNAKRVWKGAGISRSFDDVYNGADQLDESDATKLFGASHRIAVDDARSVVKAFDDLTPKRQEALVNLSYQLGKPSLSQFEDTLGYINSGNYRKAARSLLQSKYAKQTPERARKIAKMIASG